MILKDELMNIKTVLFFSGHCCVLTVEAQRYSQQENGLSRLLLLLLPDKNRSGNSSQKQPCICVPPSAFLEEEEEEIHSG